MSKHNFRTDPLDVGGNVDSSFFASGFYKQEHANLVNYLEKEGFFEKDVEYFVDFFGRKWHVYPIKKSKK